MQQWKVRVRGAPRKEVDKELLIRAVIALGKQLQQENERLPEEPIGTINRREGT